MSRHVFRTVNGRRAQECVTTLRGPSPTRPWLPALQQVAWWAVAAVIFIVMACTFGRGW